MVLERTHCGLQAQPTHSNSTQNHRQEISYEAALLIRAGEKKNKPLIERELLKLYLQDIQPNDY